MRLTLPDTGAVTFCSIFIAERTASCACREGVSGEEGGGGRAVEATEGTYRVAGLHLVALLCQDFHDNARHGRTDRSRLLGRALTADSLDGGRLVLDADETGLRREQGQHVD